MTDTQLGNDFFSLIHHVETRFPQCQNQLTRSNSWNVTHTVQKDPEHTTFTVTIQYPLSRRPALTKIVLSLPDLFRNRRRHRMRYLDVEAEEPHATLFLLSPSFQLFHTTLQNIDLPGPHLKHSPFSSSVVLLLVDYPSGPLYQGSQTLAIPAAHIQSPKSGCDWTENDLAAYNIRIVYQDALSFFQVPALPPPALKHPVVLHFPGPAYTDDPTVYELLRTMDLAMLPTYTDESAVDDFAVLLLRELGYAPAGRVIRTRKDLPLIVCGDSTLMKADVCIVDSGGILLLLVQEDRRHVGGADPLPQLVAEAIAAFDLNNMTRERLGSEPLPSKDIPGITLKGTSPIFFKIPVTQQLVAAVRSGHFPPSETVVYAHLPTIPRPVDRWYEGMRPLDNRSVIMSCYEAFKRFVN